jgi:hypothetical protein
LNRRIGVQKEHRFPLSGVELAPRDGRDAAVELDANVMSLLISYSLVLQFRL